MSQSLRHPIILDIARRDGRVSVEELAREMQVSVQTIRRDLHDLADAGQLTRVHGGAVLPSGVANIGYSDRRDLNSAAKSKMAQHCASLIPNGGSVFLNIGTTTEAVARALLQHENLLVVTNNLNVANILAANPACDVVVVGGTLRRSDGGLIGALTMRMIEQFKVDIAVIGCSAVDNKGTMLDYDLAEVGVSQTILRQSRSAILMADASKFQRTAPVCIGSLADVDRVITDQPLSAGLAEYCASVGTVVTVPG